MSHVNIKLLSLGTFFNGLLGQVMDRAYEAQLHSTLGELRALFGIHIARIACAYGLEVDSHLVGILPPEPDRDLR